MNATLVSLFISTSDFILPYNKVLIYKTFTVSAHSIPCLFNTNWLSLALNFESSIVVVTLSRCKAEI